MIQIKNMGESRSRSFPHAVSMGDTTLYTCTSSSFSSSPLWPQSFGRSMDIYSRSTSWRSRQEREPDLETSGIEPTLSEQLASPLIKTEYDIEVPLLRNSRSAVSGNGEHSADIRSSGVENIRSTTYGHKSDINEGLESEQNGNHSQDMHPHGSSFLQALFNGMNVLAGVGILSTPYAVAKGGWLGLTLLLAFAVICCYTAVLLRRCLDSDLNISSYPDVGEASFGKWGRWIVSVLLYLELYAVAIEFLILEGDNLAQLFPSASLTVGGLHLSSHVVFVVFSALCMLPTVWLRELSLLSYISAGGVVATVLIVLAVGWIGVFDGVGFHQQGTLVNLSGLPVAVGLYAFCYCGHAVFPSIYGSMKDRRQFSHVLVICFILCTLIYGGIAVMGYLMFGDSLYSQVTLNLPREAPASHFAIWVTLVNPFAKYALTITPLAVALEEFLPHSMAGSQKGLVFWGTILRTLLVISTVTVALSVPFFGLLMAFIGSFLSIAVSIHLPCICYLKLYGGRLSRRQVSLIVVILCVGLLVGTAGTYYSVQAIVHNF